jgi:hypothetical protein
MKIGIVCPGPSAIAAASHELDSQYDLWIGVNRAVLVRPCDYWVFGESKVYGDLVINHSAQIFNRLIRLVIPEHTRRELGIEPGGLFLKNSPTHQEISEKVPLSVSQTPNHDTWKTFSFTTAIALALYLGAFKVDCYGADWLPGAADWDGTPSGFDEGGSPTRHADRFQREKDVFHNLQQFGSKSIRMIKRIQEGI